MNFSNFKIKNHIALVTWITSIIIIAVITVQANYVARENDSRLYSRFTAQLNNKSISEFLSLEWRDYSPAYAETETPYVRDHLTGQFIIPVLIAKLGYSDKHAIYLTNSIYKALSLFLLFLIASRFFPRSISAFMTVLIQLTPVSLNYQMRANHEPALLLLILVAIYGSMKIKENKGCFLLILGSVQFCFLIKGIAFLPIIPIIFMTYLISNWPLKKVKISNVLILSLISSSILLTALCYEWYFKKLTGFSFFDQYIKVQLLGRSFSDAKDTLPLLGNIKALGYYISRTLSYSLPWSLFALILVVKKRFKLDLDTKQKTFYTTLICSVVVYILTFTVSSRTASRYIYPAYFLFSASCIMFILNHFKSKITITTPKFHMIAAFLFLTLSSISILKAVENASLYIH